MSSQPIYAGVEAGGTKFRAGVYTADLHPLDEIRVDTTTPGETLGAISDFLALFPQIGALGIASFGPLIVDKASPEFGSIAPTPKPGWSGVPMLSQLAGGLGVPAAIQTDVEAAAVAEATAGAGKDVASVAYVTVGTGIGIGIAIDGEVFRGRDHVEMGHIPVSRHPQDDFAGVCPFHGDCLEGMASGPALHARWDMRPSDLGDDHVGWEIETFYLAQLARVLTYSFSPDVILFSGGVAARDGLAERIAADTVTALGGYSVSHADNPKLVRRAALGNDAGLIGAALLAKSLM